MNIVIKNVTALLPNGQDSHTVYIKGQEIAGIDKEPEGFKAELTIEGEGKLLIPGLINAHTHSYMSVMRNCADDLPFMDWLLKRIDPIEGRLTNEDAYWSSLLGQLEMIRSGITTFNDQQMHIHQTTRAVAESGMRAVICRGLVGNEYDKSDRRLLEALEEMEDVKLTDRLNFRLGPHAPYSCGPDYLKMCADVARDKGIGIHIHLSESVSEVEQIKEKYGCSPIEYAAKAGVFDVSTIAAHCVQIDEKDIELLSEAGVSVVTCPASNMKLGNGFAPIPELVEKKVNVCLGTDGAASNNAQNMFREMGLLALIHKGTHKTPTCIGAKEVFDMATINGAKALGLSDIIGSIEIGKKADLVLLDLNSPSLMPNNNLLSALCYSANGSEVETVIIDGEVVMENREIKTIDEEKVYHEINDMLDRLGVISKLC